MILENPYLDRQSFLHQLNPLSKLLATMPLAIFLTLTTNVWTPLSFIVILLCLTVMLGRISFFQYVKWITPMILIIIGTMLLYPFMVSDRVNAGSDLWFSIGKIELYEAGVVYGVATGLRLLSLYVLTLLFTLTTDSADFIRAFVQQWKLNYRIGYGTLAVLRFVPIFMKQFQLVKMAHQVRGYAGKGVYHRVVERTRRYAIPLLASSLRHAERAAYAMDSRAFGAFPERTYYRKLSFQRTDYFFIAGFWLGGMLIIFILHWFGLLGEISLFKMYQS